ncbi:MAG: YiiD C-terminal domain-containing protein [Gammaproteobacteria bacterium]|nr:YiiD C-terminal domain-containing protein [Gammaproteobacteria bacterium]
MLYRHVPIAKVLGIRVVNYDGVRLVVRAPLVVNVNHYGTAFAGSIGAVLMLGGFTIIRQKLVDIGYSARIKLVKSRISYLHPVTADIEAFCELTSELSVADIERELSRDRTLKAEVIGSIQSASQTAVRYTGLYAIRALKGDETDQNDFFC